MTTRRFLAVFMVALVSVCASSYQAPDTTRPCTVHVDPVLRVQFPSRIADLHMVTRTTYRTGDDDYSLRYNSDASDDLRSGGRHLDLYVFTRDGRPIPDGAGDQVRGELEAARAAIGSLGASNASDDGANVRYEKVKVLDMIVEGRLRKLGLPYLWFSSTMKFPDHEKSHLSVTLVFAWRSRFVKLRYSEPIRRGPVKPCEALPAGVLAIVDAIDDLIVEAEAAAKVDVYAIADPKCALAALRRKWLGADDRVSQYDLPDSAEKVERIERVAKWCNEKMDERAETFLDFAQTAVRLKIEPAVWHYNVACALARLGRKDEAFQALEQSVVSGYNEVEHVRADRDLESLRTDARFEKLLRMAATIETHWNAPRRSARIDSGRVYLDESNVYWSFGDGSYRVVLDGATSNTLIYLDHNVDHVKAPSDAMVAVEYAEELQDRRRTSGAANFNFVDAASREPLPVILGCSALYDDDRTNDVQSVPARTWGDGDAADRELRHLYMNVLGVYDVGTDYACDGVDRVSGWCPVSIVHYGRKGTDDFVRLCAAAWGAMKPEVRAKGGVRQLLGLVRRGQKCVRGEETFMSSAAQRPAISLDGVDEKRVLELAAALRKPYPEIPLFVDASLVFEMTPTVDLGDEPFDRAMLSKTLHHVAFAARWAEKTGRFRVVIPRTTGKLVWKVLQGDAARVRFDEKKPMKVDETVYDVVEIACDYQEAFDVKLPNGRTMKSTRVDIGCFRVEDGVASIPAIASVYFMPAETRTYGTDGRLTSIDYTRPQIPGWLPSFCPKGDFRDEFHWTEDGFCTGWTRTGRDGVKTEFTREGLAVMTRDAKGRPLDVRRSMKMEWMQKIRPFVTTGEVYAVQRNRLGNAYDRRDTPPSESTLAWRYVYKDDADRTGKPMRKEAVKFRYAPELCPRADFSKTSGFRLPMMRQMMLGYGMYLKYKFDLWDEPDMLGWEIPEDYERSDSRYALKELNLTPPASLMKMRFAPWTPSTNDLWKVDVEEFEDLVSSNLLVQADGACRLSVEPETDGEEENFRNVVDTYFAQNTYAELNAYEELDQVYRRCGEDEVKRLCRQYAGEEGWNGACVATKEPIPFNDLPEGVTRVFAMWQVTKDVFFGIWVDHVPAFSPRTYFFTRVDRNGNARTFDSFEDLPSRAIGNAVLGAGEGNAEAINNFAVLLYAGAANPHRYAERTVVRLLTRSADLGCPVAAFNLGVLHFNRGETEKANVCFEQAKDAGYGRTGRSEDR